MNRALYVSTNCFPDRSTEGIRAAVQLGGWTHVEFSEIRASAGEAISLCRQLRMEGIEVVLHNYFPPAGDPFLLNLASLNPELLQRSRRHCEEAISLSAELGSPFFAAHAGFAVDFPPSLLGDPQSLRRFHQERKDLLSEKEAKEVFAESVKQLADFGKQHEVRFLVENHVAEERLGYDAARSLLLYLEPDDFGELAKKVGEDSFGMLLDVGHLRCTSQVLGFSKEEFCSALSQLICAFHLSDNDGHRDSHQPFGDQAWFLPVVRSHPQAVATLEFNRCSREELLRSAQLVQDS